MRAPALVTRPTTTHTHDRVKRCIRGNKFGYAKDLYLYGEIFHREREIQNGKRKWERFVRDGKVQTRTHTAATHNTTNTAQ